MTTPPIMRLQYDVLIGHSIDVYESLSTTNGHLMTVATKSTPSHGTAIVAHHQTAGRGQIGRSWHDEADKNLLISYLVRPDHLPLDQQYLLNLVVAISVRDCLADLDLDARIKWPNDVYVGNKKIAGLLVQCSLQGSKIQYAVLGIGLNINQSTWPADIPNPTSIRNETDNDHDPLELAASLSRHLSATYDLLTKGHSIELRRRYHEHLYLCDTWASYEVDGQARSGQLIEVDTEGRAVIEWRSGEVVAYRHGTISLIVASSK